MWNVHCNWSSCHKQRGWPSTLHVLYVHQCLSNRNITKYGLMWLRLIPDPVVSVFSEKLRCAHLFPFYQKEDAVELYIIAGVGWWNQNASLYCTSSINKSTTVYMLYTMSICEWLFIITITNWLSTCLQVKRNEVYFSKLWAVRFALMCKWQTLATVYVLLLLLYNTCSWPDK